MLIFNLDITDFHHYNDPSDGGAQINPYIDRILDGQVTHFLINTLSRGMRYGSGEVFPKGYDPEGPDDQPFLAPLGKIENIKSTRHLMDKVLDLHRQGIDYPARVIKRARERGAAAWLSLRVNDVHNLDNEGHPIHSTFWRSNPHMRRKGYEGYFSKALDFGHKEVRADFQAILVDQLEHYSPDGIELDFMREPYLFSRGEEAAGAEILNGWIREIHELVVKYAEKCGHDIQLGVRVPSRPEVSERFGIDAIKWAQEGLIDLLVPTPRWASLEFDIPIRKWRELLAGSSTALAGGLEVLYQPFRNASPHGVTAAQARGAAAQILASGADGVYLFNYFPSGGPTGEEVRWWTPREYPEILKTLGSLPDLKRHPRSYALTSHDVNAPDGNEVSSDSLPRKGAEIDLLLPTGPRPERDHPAELILDIEIPVGTTVRPPAVCINGSDALDFAYSRIANSGRSEYPIPGSYLHCVYELSADGLKEVEENEIKIRSEDGLPILVLSLSINILS
ncbi:MAG: hypothetical protein HQL31_11435 [Planctomycetes bacterium]|nr:hypothetical protein [Planctomycetota bacterium]